MAYVACWCEHFVWHKTTKQIKRILKKVYCSLPEIGGLSLKQKFIPPLRQRSLKYCDVFALPRLVWLVVLCTTFVSWTHTVCGMIFSGLTLQCELCLPNLPSFHVKKQNCGELWRKYRLFFVVNPHFVLHTAINNNNEYLECLTNMGPQCLHILYIRLNVKKRARKEDRGTRK